MGFLQKLRFEYLDPEDMVLSAIKRWKPRACETEKQYENSLYDFLHKEFPDIQITKQFANGRVRADIVVGGKIIIELKNNLDTTAKYQRLMGQLMAYEEWDGQVFVLLTGKTDPNLRKQLSSYAQQAIDADLGDDTESIIVIEK
jgi:hypothetical protein